MVHLNKDMVYRDQQGMTLYLVILMMVVVFTLAGGFMTYTYVDLKNADHIAQKRQDCYSANAAVERAIYIINDHKGTVLDVDNEKNGFCRWVINEDESHRDIDVDTGEVRMYYYDIMGYALEDDNEKYQINVRVGYKTADDKLTILEWENLGYNLE